MDPTQINRLKEEYLKGLQLCQEKLTLWTKFKADYEALEDRLHGLPEKLSYDITVPFGSNAFVEGKIVHTNEITVLLGDGWFADVSSKQASAIASRRIKHCSKTLEDLEKEKEQFQNWLNYINEVSKNEDLVEIVETFDEAEEKKWREQHAKNVRAYRQRQRKDSSLSSCASSLEEEVAQQMGHLDLTEEESESKSLHDSEDGSTFDYSDDGSMLSESPGTGGSHIFPNDERHLMEGTKAEGEGDDNAHSEKHVRWQDLSKKSMRRITFKHSRIKKLHVKGASGVSPDSPEACIQSPSDIYRHFDSFFPASPPKSILKVKPSSPGIDSPQPSFTSEECELSDSPEHFAEKKSLKPAFTGEVREHSGSPSSSLEKKSHRPASHFKSSRKNRKK